MRSSQEHTDLTGVILAAGEGRRIRPLSRSVPKPLLPVLDRPLIHRQVEAMRALGIREVVVVVGHLAQELIGVLGDGSRHGLRIRYVEQERALGIAHALRQAEPVIRGPFLLFLGDVYFEADDLSLLVAPLRRPDVDAVIAVHREHDQEAIRHNFSVELGPDGYVREVVEKPVQPRSEWKGIGLYAFRSSIFDAVRRTPRTALRNEYELTDAIQLFIEGGGRVVAAPAVGLDFNLSEPSELLALNLHCLKRKGRDVFVASNADLSPHAQVHATVVLSGASIEAGAELERCLVMPGERVPKGRYRDAVFFDGEALVCG